MFPYPLSGKGQGLELDLTRNKSLIQLDLMAVEVKCGSGALREPD